MGKYNKITQEQDKQIALLYKEGKNCAEIGKIFGVWGSAILDSLKREGVPRRGPSECHKTCSVNAEIFFNIDTPEKAYWLGFLYADGYNNESRGITELKLAIKDKFYVKKFKDFIQSTNKIGIYKQLNKTTGKIHANCTISISDKKLSENLAKKGCFQKKSLTLKFPTEEQVPKYLIWHFLRGYFDGDGSINLEDYSLSMATSKYFAKALKQFCKENDINGYVHKHITANCFYFKIGQRFEFAKFFENLYKDSENLRMKRKYKRYEKTIKKLDKYFQSIYDYMKLRNLVKY